MPRSLAGGSGGRTSSSQVPGQGVVTNCRPHCPGVELGLAIARRVSRNSPDTFFPDIAIRLRNVKINCGGWEDTLDKGLQRKSGIIAILFDPPYSGRTKRQKDLYPKDSLTAADDVVKYARVMGMEKNFRIAVCGMKDEHVLPGWACLPWTNHGGNKHRRNERIWFSPHCLQPQSQKAG